LVVWPAETVPVHYHAETARLVFRSPAGAGLAEAPAARPIVSGGRVRLSRLPFVGQPSRAQNGGHAVGMAVAL